MEGKALKEKSRVEQFERIRRDHRAEGLSVRALAARHRVHRRTVRQAFADAVPPAPKVRMRISPALGPHEATVRGWLVADLDAPRKQRHTAPSGVAATDRGPGSAGQVAESSVRAMVARSKVEMSLTVARSRTLRPPRPGWRRRSTSGSSGGDRRDRGEAVGCSRARAVALG